MRSSSYQDHVITLHGWGGISGSGLRIEDWGSGSGLRRHIRIMLSPYLVEEARACPLGMPSGGISKKKSSCWSKLTWDCRQWSHWSFHVFLSYITLYQILISTWCSVWGLPMVSSIVVTFNPVACHFQMVSYINLIFYSEETSIFFTGSIFIWS